MAAQRARSAGPPARGGARSRRSRALVGMLQLLLIGGPLVLLGAGGFGYYAISYRPSELVQMVRGFGVPFGFSQFDIDVGPGDTTYDGRSVYEDRLSSGSFDTYRPVENTAIWMSELGFPFAPTRIERCYEVGCSMQRVISGHDIRITLSVARTSGRVMFIVDLHLDY